ncbi:hypothetical protein VB1_CDS0032 [Arthrobacter phage Marchesin]|nr:hypothetical protein VB1_CDS0032 [Arthrobacter phage Marchesin]
MKLAHSRNDLPISWDGERITWDEWSDFRTSLAYHLKAEDLACEQCGTVDEVVITWGLRDPPAGTTAPTTRTKTTRSGRKYQIVEDLPARPLRDIYAARCRHCGHDVVTDTRTNERWDLEPEDYGPAGSNPPQPETLF